MTKNKIQGLDDGVATAHHAGKIVCGLLAHLAVFVLRFGVNSHAIQPGYLIPDGTHKPHKDILGVRRSVRTVDFRGMSHQRSVTQLKRSVLIETNATIEGFQRHEYDVFFLREMVLYGMSKGDKRMSYPRSSRGKCCGHSSRGLKDSHAAHHLSMAKTVR